MEQLSPTTHYKIMKKQTIKEIIRRGGPVWPPWDKNGTNGDKGRHTGLPLQIDKIINITTCICYY